MDLEVADLFNINKYLEGIVGLFKQAGWVSDKSKIVELLKSHNSFAVIAKKNNELVGFVYCICYDNHAWTGYVNTAPKLRRHGIATALKRKIIEVCRERKVSNIRLITREELKTLNENVGFFVEKSISTYEKEVPLYKHKDLSIPNEFIDKIINFDSKTFNGNRKDRIVQHLKSTPFSYCLLSNNSIIGYSFSWNTKLFTRIGPTILPIGYENIFFKEFVSKIQPQNGILQILIYDDDEEFINAATNKGFNKKKEWIQMCNKINNSLYNEQNKLIRTIWGRATG